MAVLLFLLASVSAQSLTKIAFGSCAGMFGAENSGIFRTIDLMKPDLFVWLGDVVYADTMVGPLIFKPPTETEWRKKFMEMKDKEGYKELRQHTQILGVWDDHDYGINDGNKNFEHKELARRIYLEFLDEKPESLRWTRAGGIYESYVFGPEEQSVKVILLDVRFSADPWGPDGDSLGEEQWKWLELELKAPGKLTIIGNGLQIMVEDRFGVTEKWHPKSRTRLYELLKSVPNVILLSGDVHMSEIMLNPCLTYPLYEFTSSGMTHSVGSTFGFIHYVMTHLLMPYTYNIGHRVTIKNFSMISIDWSLPDPIITFSIHDTEGSIQLSHSFSLTFLSSLSVHSEVCESSPMKRYVFHVVSSFAFYVLPVFIIGLGIRLFNTRVRKH